MSVEELKRQIIPLIQAGSRDDVRCLLLIHLKDHPQDDEVWRWYVAAAETPDERLQVVESWLRANPNSDRAQNAYDALLPRPVYRRPARSATRADGVPFSAREFLKSLFVGQRWIVDELASTIETVRFGRNLNLLLRAPGGWGKTLLASLFIGYVDPQGGNSHIYASAPSLRPEDLLPVRYHLIEDVDQLVQPEALLPAMQDGQRTFLFTTRGGGNLPDAFVRRVREFTFVDYSQVDLGEILRARLYRKDIEISTRSMLQIAQYCRGNPKVAVSYAERLAMIWQEREVDESIGELVYLLNNPLKLSPQDVDHNYLAIWDDQTLRAIGVGGILESLHDRGFPFGLNFLVRRADVQFIQPENRKALVGGEIISLPAYIFQKSFNPAGPLAPTLSNAQTQAIILGAYSEEELRAFVRACGFIFDDRSVRQRSGSHQPIPEEVQVEVWERDQGCCVRCGSRANLGFDHLIPPARGGSSTARNLQILCQRCYQVKTARIGG